MKSIEIVTHCYAGKLPLYAQHLRFQLASLIHHPPKAKVTHSLLWAGPERDPATLAVVEDMCFFPSLRAESPVHFVHRMVSRETLFRRAIWRHERTQNTHCDILWLADADMAFGLGAIDAVCEQVQDDGKLYFPRKSLMSIDHATGEQTLKSAEGIMWPQIDPTQFKSQRNYFAIGGIQILGKETAKRVGYLGFKEGEPGYNWRHKKWSQPVDPEKPFAEFRDDTAWRRHHFNMADGQQRQVKIDVPNLYRLRHEFSSLRPEGFKASEQSASQ